jgi:hypothetical protein
MTRVRGVLLVMVALAALGVYLTGGSVPYDFARQRAPDGQGMLELATPARWQAWQARNFDMPAVARYIEADGTVVGPSAPFELSGAGSTYWDAEGLSIGSTAVYDRRTRTWSVQD